jgi:peptide/nickel transport system permease protein
VSLAVGLVAMLISIFIGTTDRRAGGLFPRLDGLLMRTDRPVPGAAAAALAAGHGLLFRDTLAPAFLAPRRASSC